MKYWTVFKDELTKSAWKQLCIRFGLNPDKTTEISFVGEVQDVDDAVKIGSK